MIYLDNSATTPLCQAAKDKMIAAMEVFGNPSSLHDGGLAAEKLVEEARSSLFSALAIRNPRAWELIFTASGSEANNQLLFGVLRAKKFRFTPRVITTDSEHPSVAEPLAVLEREGVEVVRLSTKGGAIQMDELAAAVNENTVLVSIMTVNNETGAKYDIQKAFRIAKAKNRNLITHTDCVQGFLKVKFSPELMGADAVTISSHKIHGPKGVGALLLSKALITAKRVTPLIYGGGQENGMRSGTENVMGIAGFGAAASVGASSLADFTVKMPKLREIFLSHLHKDIRVNTPSDYAPHIISITLPKIRSEIMLHRLSEDGIYVSSGSACANNKKGSNYVLPAFGLTPAEADTTLRISLAYETSKADLILAAEKLNAAYESLSLVIK